MFSEVYITGLGVNHLGGLPWMGWEWSRAFWADSVKSQVGLSRETESGVLTAHCDRFAPRSAAFLPYLRRITAGVSECARRWPTCFLHQEDKEKLSIADTVLTGFLHGGACASLKPPGPPPGARGRGRLCLQFFSLPEVAGFPSPSPSGLWPPVVCRRRVEGREA